MVVVIGGQVDLQQREGTAVTASERRRRSWIGDDCGGVQVLSRLRPDCRQRLRAVRENERVMDIRDRQGLKSPVEREVLEIDDSFCQSAPGVHRPGVEGSPGGATTTAYTRMSGHAARTSRHTAPGLPSGAGGTGNRAVRLRTRRGSVTARNGDHDR